MIRIYLQQRKIKSLQDKIDLNKTFSRREGISNEEILTIPSKVETQRKELLDYYHNDLLVNNEYSMYKIAFENLFNYWEMEY